MKEFFVHLMTQGQSYIISKKPLNKKPAKKFILETVMIVSIYL
jgi:hypothetical protein